MSIRIINEQGTRDIKAKHPGITELPENGWDWAVEKLVSHFVKMAKKKGRGAISKAIQNIIPNVAQSVGNFIIL